MELGKKAAGIVLIMILFGGTVQFGNAFDYFDNSIGRNDATGFTSTPTVCVLDINNPSKYYTIRALKSWEIALREHTQTNLYDYNIKMIDNFERGDCNIYVVFGNPKVTFPEVNTTLGAIACFNHNDQRFCEIVVNPEERFWYNALVHEMGHAIGLGHRMTDNPRNFAGLVIEDDIMFSKAKKYERITVESLDAIEYFYQYKGWNKGITDNYIVPHPELIRS